MMRTSRGTARSVDLMDRWDRGECGGVWIGMMERRYAMSTCLCCSFVAEDRRASFGFASRRKQRYVFNSQNLTHLQHKKIQL